jgi:23S rRNA (adenine2503-C2)-methyltransferase
MHIAALQQHLQGQGGNAAHVSRVLRQWLNALPQDAGKRRIEDYLPLRLRQDLPQFEQQLQSLVTLHSRHSADDGSERLLLTLADGQQIETVLLPRGGLCVSTQVGCAVGCVFCMTGRGGLVRQVGSAEIVAQVALARQIQPVRRVVFMGMGEPAHNLDAVMDAIALLGNEGNIGHKDLVFSTVGDERVFERLPQGPVRPALALSLHSCFDDRRRQLLPKAPAVPVAQLVAAAEVYARDTGYPVQYQWTLLQGLNDGDDELEAIAALLAGKHAMMNFIPWNAIEGLPYQRPSWERAAQMANFLNRRGILTRLRRSAGQDVDGGCGQLRARAAVSRRQRSAP